MTPKYLNNDWEELAKIAARQTEDEMYKRLTWTERLQKLYHEWKRRRKDKVLDSIGHP